MLTQNGLRPGDKIRVNVPTMTTDEKRGRIETVTVIKQYPHHVLVERRSGQRFCVTNADLYVAKMKAMEEPETMNSTGERVKIKRKREGYTSE